MQKEMTNEQKDKYILHLENEVERLNKINDSLNYDKLSTVLKAQEDFLICQYADKDNLIADNKRLNKEIDRLIRTIMFDNSYIDYLLNSFGWKITFPFRAISRKVRKKMEKIDYDFVENISLKKDFEIIDEKVSVIIFTYNAGEEFSVQLKNINSQKNIKDFEIIVIDKGSTDNTIKISKDAKAKVISLKNNKLTDDEIYEQCLPNIHGKYIAIIEQNKIVDSKYWLYQAIRPIIDNKAIMTAFFNQDVSFIKNTTYYQELKKRMASIANEQVLFFPQNRDVIQYISPYVLDKTCIIVKKKVSNMFLI